MATPTHGIMIRFERSTDLIEHAPNARRQRWATITHEAREVERLHDVMGWGEYNALYRVVDALDMQHFYLVEEA